MSPAQREYVLKLRKTQKLPWHGPPHYYKSNRTRYHLTATCYEHRHIIGKAAERMVDLETTVLNNLSKKDLTLKIYSWCILPNHYHILVKKYDVSAVLTELGKMHGRLSREWNKEENKVGRKIWHRSTETAIKSDKHFWSTMNYIHHNAVHHKYVTKWNDWVFSSSKEYISHMGRNKAELIWEKYPIDGYGKVWDPPDL